MCQYWKKCHTCTHLSDRPYIEMCRPGFLSNIVCQDIGEDPSPRRSHFPCWQCIKASARTESEEKRAQAHALATAAEIARDIATKGKIDMEKRAREERVRREAREKAERERVLEHKIKIEREKEMERAKKEGGPWVLAEAGSGKKKKGRGSVPASPASPGSPSILVGVTEKDAWKENGKTVWKENEKGVDASGRAGTWGPKKILSRKEGAAGTLSSRTDATNDMNAKK
ncbi:hypothetical protein BU25DRAFT_342399 [Macroventuria anomochaeta]|uniref:Uncharacterized protein n=1 Tax=Macroventuria anomochaeta TaxID=301207 RepID=A0ACB6S1V6_9PLEO|nr:uncharacterized protein BU25DRAFT_342399 [Macroventuria anomochaeta]KAF2627189.1 hypothetical protein BU25DRAFT_342399 [Macroventuria anomochaeta]